jgi:uncharacterized membrane protein
MPVETKPIDVTATIEIARNAQTVFDYLANYANDPRWRAEIRDVQLSTPAVREKTQITEVSFLSKKVPRHVSVLQCVAWQPGRAISSESTAGSPYWSRNTREVEPLPGSGTRVTYRLQFDPAVVKHGLGFGLPRFVVRFYTKATMKKYLAVLKGILEK